MPFDAYANSNTSNFSNGVPGFSLYQTEPIQGNHSGQYWNQGHGGVQYSDQNLSSPSGYAPNGISDSFDAFCVSEDSHAMARQDSVGAQSTRTTHSSVANAYEQAQSVGMYHSLSQVSYHMSSASSGGSLRSNSPDYTPTPQLSQHFDSYSFPGEDMSGEQKMFQRDSVSSMQPHMLTDTSFSTAFPSANDAYISTYIPGQSTQDTIIFNDSPTLLDADFLEGQRVPPMIQEEYWSLPPPHLLSPASSHPGYSPSEESGSPAMYVQEVTDIPRPVVRSTKKTGPRQSKVNSDIARNSRPSGPSEASDESLKYNGRTPDADNNARIHKLYQIAAPMADGLYHCPWEGKDNCQHKPEKLKCNYDKCVDSHLKPYRCKLAQCEALQFSSTACLLRHEREAHAMHGHGEKPFLCRYDGCDRGAPGNGFPRHWNLRDHMKRVHNDPGVSKSNASGGSPPPSAPVVSSGRSKKRKGELPGSPVVEKSGKVSKKTSRQDKEQASDELYQQSYQNFFHTVQRLQDPRVPEYQQLFQEAYGSLQTMRDTAQEINGQIYVQHG